MKRRAAGWPGNTAYRHRDAGSTVNQRPGHHLFYGFFRYGTEFIQRFCRDAEHFLLGDIGIRDETAFIPLGTAGYGGNRLADPAAGA